jgi:hypothetical protein
VPDWEKGKWRTDPKLGQVRWAFVRIELLVGDSDAPELPLERAAERAVIVVPAAWTVHAVAGESLSEVGLKFLAALGPKARPPPD